MQDKKVKISNILGSLIPEFVHVDNPLFKDFLKQYYTVEEREYGSTNLADNLAEYKNISTLADIETVRAQTINLETTGIPEAPIVVTAPVFAYDQKIYTIHNDGFPLTYGLLKIDDEIITYTGKNSNEVVTKIYARHPVGQTKRDPVLVGTGTTTNPQYTNAFIVDNTLKRTTILLDTTVVAGFGPNQIAVNNFAKIEAGMSFTATYQDDKGTELPVFPTGTFILAADATTGAIVVSNVPISTANLDYAPNYTISTTTEEGIVSSTVPVGILFNIIDNSFTGCARGFSGISKIETQGNPEELTFSKTNAAAHDLSAGVLNLNFEFLGQFYKKFKTNFLPGVENRKFATGLSIENILTRAKDFFISKGTDQSLDILFKVLFGKQVSVNKPYDNTISASDAEWLTSDEIIVDAISGNPMNLQFSSLYQGESSNFLTNSTASGAIENIEEVFLDDKTYYKIFLSKETVKSKFNIGSKTKVIKSEFNDLSTVTVDSTIGFGATGVFWYQDIDGVYQKAEYTSKSYNQFFGCVGVTTSREGQLIIGNEFVHAYEDNDTTKPCQMRVLGTVSGVSDGFKHTKYSTKGDKITLKNLGEMTSESNIRFNSWIYNNVSETDIQEIDTSSRVIEVKVLHYLKKGDKIDIFEKYTRKPLDSNVEVDSIISGTKFNYKGNGNQSSLLEAPLTGYEYVIKKNINIVDSNLGTGALLGDIQNTFLDKDKNAYIAFSGYPSSSIQTTDRSKTFTTSGVTTGSYQSPGAIQITNHGFITGEKIYYEPISSQSGSGIKLGYVNQSGVLVNSGVTGITTGTYYVSKVDDNNIRLSISRHNIFSSNTLWDSLEYPIGIGTFSDSHKITPYSLWEGNSLQNQNNFKRILKTPELKIEENDDIVGSIGVTLDGVELNSPITEDAVYYGQIDKCNVLNSGRDYDIINPPNVSIADTSGTGFEPNLHLSGGHVADLVLTSSGYDYRNVPAITVSGGNGTGVVAEARMGDLTQIVSFGDSLVGTGTTIGTIALNQEHRFLDGEEVVYTVSSNGHAIGIGSTNTTVGVPVPGAGSTSSLVNGGIYYVAKNGESNLSLAVTKQRAIDKKFLLDFVDDGSGTHTLTATRTRKILDRIVLRTHGEGFSTNKVEIDAQPYPPTTRTAIMSTFVGINTSDNYIFAKNHNYKTGEIVKYTKSNTVVGGLADATNYYVTVVDKNKFKLSTNETSYLNKDYINFTSVGVGTHTFNYSDIVVSVEGATATGIGLTAGASLPSYYNASAYPVVKGKISNVFIKNGGVGYGVSTIINHVRKPSLTIQNGDGENGSVDCIIDTDGKISSAYVVNEGKNYTSPPILEVISTGKGQFGKLRVNISDGKLDSVDVLNPGNNYTQLTTSVELTPAGIDGVIDVEVHKWKINAITRYDNVLSNPNYKETVQIPASLKTKGNKLVSYYATKNFRSILGDNIRDNQEEAIADDRKHSPIIGWAYDGNPIYGPYGNAFAVPDATGNFGGVKRIESSYSLNAISDTSLRPAVTSYANGFFVDDYEYNEDAGDLDEYNGRYVINDDFPEGSYAYFSTIDTDSGSSSPTYPYTTLRHFNKTDSFNYDSLIDQSDEFLNSGSYRRNVTHLGLNGDYRRYRFLDEPKRSGTSILIDSVRSAGLTTIFIDHSGDNYGVGDAVTFADSDVVNGKIKDVFGKNIVSIASSSVSIDSLTFSVKNNTATAFSTLPHAYKDGDAVQISGITSFAYSSLEGSKFIGVTTTITTNSVAIANTATTGVSTFIRLKEPSWSPKFQVNDVIQIGNERMIILNKDNYNNRYRVCRMHQGTSGTAHNVGTVVKRLSQEFTFPIQNTANKDIILSKKFNFEGPSIPNQTTNLDGSIGIGSTAQSRLVGYVGLSTITKTIPERAIYLPDHEFKTGDQLSYVSVGSTLKYSITDALTPQLDITGISTFFCIKWNKDFIGISTQKVGVSTAVGFTSTAVWFTAQTEGKDHRFETVTTNITGQAQKIVGTVLLDVKHDLALQDEIKLDVDPSLIDLYDFRFDPEIKKLVVNPLEFASSGVSTGTNSTITIPSHNLNTGDIVYYKAANAIGGLTTKNKYHVIKISDNVIRLAKTKVLLNKVPSENIVFTAAGSGNHELLRVNPGIKVYRGNVVSIGVSNPSMSDYDIDFYYDREFKSKLDSTTIVKTGVFGDADLTTKITINTDDSLPSTIFYKVSGKSTNFVNTLDHTNTDVVDYSSIKLLDSKFNGLQRISGIGTTTFDFNMVGFAETTSYNTAGFSTASYTTNSETAKGGINSIEINQLKLSEKLVRIVGIGSTGSEALFSEESNDIGEIVGTLVENQGFGYSSDKTLTPSAEVYTVLKLKDVYTLDSVGVETGGRNYTSRPNIIAIGNTAITLNAILDGNTVGGVEIVSNDSGLSQNIKFVPTFNSNGIGVVDASSNFGINQLKLKAPVVGFSTFPFVVGDKIWVENVRITDGMDGYNSSDYEYRFFTISAVNTTGGAESISYPITGIGSTGGTFDTTNVFGRVIKESDLVKFTANLKKVNFVEGEQVSQINGNASGTVAKDGWDPVSQLLKLKDVTGNFEEGVKVSSSLLDSKSITQKIYNFDFDLTVDSIVNKSTTWNNDKGKLNSNHQKIHDNDYYQRFSYAIQGEVPFDSWKEPVTSLGHISGYKPFGDLEILNGVGSTAGMGTFSGDVSLEIKIESDAATYSRYYYDNVTESTNDPTYSKIITFGGKILTDYSESRTNKVLMIDDIANQFTGKNKTFTGIHTFISAGTNSVSVITGGSGGLTPDAGTEYDASTGVLTIVTASAHGLSNGATISILDNSLIFRCNFDNYGSDHPYPRPSDPASTSNSRFNNGILSVGNTTANSFTVTVNTPVIGGQNVGLSTFNLYTIDEKGVEPTGVSTERLFVKTVQPSLGINLTDNEFSIANNEFNTGEPLIYSSNGFTRIGIDTATISGVSTNFLPEEVYAIVDVNEGIREKTKFKLASSASNANAGTALTITSVGTGNTHTFAVPTELATNRTLITIDNVIQSPLTFKKNIPLQLSTAVGSGSTQVFLHNISRVSAGLIKIENELIKVEAVGVGSTNALNVFRGAMGSVAAAHTVGAAVTVVSGDYKIENGIIHFTDAPYGPTGIGSLTTRSTFSGRSFYRLKYDKNFIFDDLSEEFNSEEKDFFITSNGSTISGITTNYGFVLVNNIWQDPHHGEGGSNLNTSDYQIAGAGTSITFAGTYANNTYVASATKDLPQGGIINQFDINPGVGIQSAFTATGIATVGAGGTIQFVSIGNSGSGYLYPPKVSVAITNYHYDHKFVSASPNSVVSAGSTNYTPSYAHYTSKTGQLILTINNHGLGTNDTVRIVNNTIVFQCSKDGYTTDHPYPRATDPVAGIQTAITNATTNTITVNVGRGAGIGASFTATIDNGMVTGVTVTNPGAGYTTSYQPIITIDPPNPWKNLPLTGGQGSGATLDVVVGTGGSAIQYELSNPGAGYAINDVLSLNPVPYKVGVSTTPLTLTVKNRHQDKFAGWTVGQLLEMDPFSSLFNGFRKQFLITRTVGGVKGYFSIIAKKDSGVVLANNLLVYVNDVLQKPVIDYNFEQGTRITFNDAPRRGSKVRLYLYVASRDDYFDVDIDETIKPGDTLMIQPNLPTYGESVPYDPNSGDKQHPVIDPSYPSQEDRIVYELISSDSVETQTYGGPGIATNGLGNIPRPVLWSKQQADTVIDGVPISKSRVYLEPEITPNTNIIAPVSATDTKLYVRNIYPTFYAYDDIGQNLNNIRLVGFGSTAITITSNNDGNVGPGTITSGNSVGDATGETGVLNYEEIKRVSYTGDHGVIVGINTGKTGVGTHQLIFDLHPAVNIQNEVSRTGLNTGDFFVIENTIIGSGVTALGITTSTIVGTGTTWINGVYQVADFTTTGVGASTLRVTCHVESLTGIDTTGLPAPISGATGRPDCGTYTWGTINVSRSSNSKSFSYYNSNGLAGIETSAYVSRLLGLA